MIDRREPGSRSEDLLTDVGSSTVISSAADVRGDYRYSLSRVWEQELPRVTWVLLNPSTADAEQLDPTMRRCVSFAKREGFGGMEVVNLYAFRTKSPRAMLDASDPVGAENDSVLASVRGVVIAGWGVHAKQARVAAAVRLLPPLLSLGTTREGHPRHPLYVRADTPLVPWAPSPRVNAARSRPSAESAS